MCETIATTPAIAATLSPASQRASSTARKPLPTSTAKTARPALVPSALCTLVAPVRWLPMVRTSTPATSLPNQSPVGMPPRV